MWRNARGNVKNRIPPFLEDAAGQLSTREAPRVRRSSCRVARRYEWNAPLAQALAPALRNAAAGPGRGWGRGARGQGCAGRGPRGRRRSLRALHPAAIHAERCGRGEITHRYNRRNAMSVSTSIRVYACTPTYRARRLTPSTASPDA